MKPKYTTEPIELEARIRTEAGELGPTTYVVEIDVGNQAVWFGPYYSLRMAETVLGEINAKKPKVKK